MIISTWYLFTLGDRVHFCIKYDKDTVLNILLMPLFLLLPISVTWGGGGYHMTKTVQNVVAQAISEIVHIEDRLVCYMKIYLTPI